MANSFIPKEQAQAFTRWEANSFDKPVPPPGPTTSTAPPPTPAEEVTQPVVETGPEEVEPSFSLPTAEDVERINTEARTEGYQAGYDEGYAAGQEAAKAHVEQLEALVNGARDALNTFDQEIAETLLACSLEVANQMTKAIFTVRPEILLPIIREALGSLPPHHGAVSLLVNPDDEELVKQHLGDQFSHAGWQFLGDSSIPPGGCKVSAGASEVDASLPSRWRRILEAIGVSPEWLDEQP
ncbi:MAG: flagellar assembly protein FliH [Azovibrio sp.]